MVDYNFINVHRRDDCGILCAFKNCGCNYFAPGIGAKYCNPRVCMSVCLSLHSHISKATCPNFTKLSAHVIYNHGSVLRRPQCNALPTSGFVDDVMFLHIRPFGQNQRRRHVSSSSPGGSTGTKSNVYDCLVRRLRHEYA